MKSSSGSWAEAARVADQKKAAPKQQSKKESRMKKNIGRPPAAGSRSEESSDDDTDGDTFNMNDFPKWTRKPSHTLHPSFVESKSTEKNIPNQPTIQS